MSEKEYIERGALIENIKNMPWKITPAAEISKGIFLQTVEEAPASDVVEVRHGEWILWKPRRENRNATYKCSVCGKLRSSYYNDVGEWAYCPCGARMDGERKEQT